ncbi:MAG: hypothetical protein RR293_08470, partial [Bacteroidales bacterium]
MAMWFRNTFLLAMLMITVNVMAYETPTMGWSSWNTYRVNINADLIMKQAKAMLDNGLKDVGYKYINIDDGYFGGRGADGVLKIHPTRFPDGLKPVADYIHSLGFKAGLYSDAGHNTCGSFWDKDDAGINAGLYEHDQQDANFFFKDLGFDFIKIDFCGGDPVQNFEHLKLDERERYTAIHNAIVNTGRKDVRMNICRWAFPGAWVHEVGTSWRISGDISANWGAVRRIIEINLFLSPYAVGGTFNDMDMLEVGRGMSIEEDKTHFGMWCMMSSPLLIGCDMTSISSTTLALLKNEDLISLNQDPLALQAYVVNKINGVYVLVKDVNTMYGNKRAVALYNPQDGASTIKLNFKDICLAGNVKMRDMFERRDIGEINTDSYDVNIPAHGTRIYLLEGAERTEQVRYEAENAWLDKYTNIKSGNFARAQFDNTLSSGAKVSYIGGTAVKDNFIEWRNVYSKEGGTYKMNICYLSGEDRSLSYSINGGAPVLVGGLNSGDWNTVGYKNIEINLNKGENTIRFENNSAWAPDIDYIEIIKTGGGISYSSICKPVISSVRGPSYITNAELVNANGAIGVIDLSDILKTAKQVGATPELKAFPGADFSIKYTFAFNWNEEIFYQIVNNGTDLPVATYGPYNNVYPGDGVHGRKTGLYNMQEAGIEVDMTAGTAVFPFTLSK